MADDKLNLTQPFSTSEIYLKLVDNGDDTYSISASDAALLSQLQAMNPLSSVVYDTVLITYTDVNKNVISKVEWKLDGDVVYTLTPTFGATTDAWVKT